MQYFGNAGRLTEVIALDVVGPGGEWTEAYKCYAEKKPMTGREFQAADSVRPAAPVRFRIRYDAGIAALDTRVTRLRHRDDLYNLVYIEDADNAHVTIYLVTEREDP